MPVPKYTFKRHYPLENYFKIDLKVTLMMTHGDLELKDHQTFILMTFLIPSYCHSPKLTSNTPTIQY